MYRNKSIYKRARRMGRKIGYSIGNGGFPRWAGGKYNRNKRISKKFRSSKYGYKY